MTSAGSINDGRQSFFYFSGIAGFASQLNEVSSVDINDRNFEEIIFS
jgi:hypothetical protein